MNRRSHAHGLCGPDCGYKPLYEGSQSSLSDMASKQAGALGRVSRLRQGIILELKQAFPVEFADAERHLGKRMSDLDDEVLLAYLAGFLAMPKAQTAVRATYAGADQPAPEGAEVLRAELAAAGVVVPTSTDLAQWASAVNAWAESKTAPQVVAIPPTEPGRAPAVSVSDARLDTPTTPEVPAAVQPARTPFGVPTPPVPRTTRRPAARDQGADAPSTDESAPWDALFADAPAWAAPDVPPPAADLEVPAAVAEDLGGPVDLLVGLFDEEPEPVAVEPEPVAPVPVPPDPAAPVTPEETTTPPPAAGRDETPAAEPAVDPAAAVNTRTSGPIKPIPAGGSPTSSRAPARAPARATKAPPKTRGRKPRVSAAGPGSASDPIEALTHAAAAAGGEITDELRDKFLAVVCMPRPVFSSDLVEMVGDADLVAAWEAEYRALGASGPLRFIAAKQRHKARGALILPFSEELRTASDGFEKSLWARCINAPNLKGAKLYELAVLLHRVIDQVVTFDIGKLTVSMRVNQQRGLVGVVLVLDPETGAGSAARDELGAGMESLAEGRLTLLAVCTYAGGPRSVPDLAQTAREEIDARRIDPTFPVIAQHSWTFASDGGTSAVSVL